MSQKYEDSIVEEFQKFIISNFSVVLNIKKLFLCGGIIDVENAKTPSFRDRFFSYATSNYPNVYKNIVLAETFKDYFKDNTYTDLMIFEEDIANISSLVIIILESPGALVELGMFCSKPNLFNKLLIVVNDNLVKEEDSFIFLGPLQYIQKRDPHSVARYPWNEAASSEDDNYLDDLCNIIEGHQNTQAKTSKFRKENSGHLSLLIAEVITVCFPILIGEIELALDAVDIDMSTKKISRHLYILMKLDIIRIKSNGNSHGFYYPTNQEQKKLMFGKTKDNKGMESFKLRMSILKSFVPDEDYLSKRRQNVLRLINKEFEELKK
jgi:hypothetical protein